MIALVVLRVILEDMYGMFGKIKLGLIEMMDEHVRILQAERIASQFREFVNFSIFQTVEQIQSP